MALHWVLHCLLVSALLGAAALVAERVLRGVGRQGRWVWATSLLGSLLLPLAAWRGWLPGSGWLGWSVGGLLDGWGVGVGPGQGSAEMARVAFSEATLPASDVAAGGKGALLGSFPGALWSWLESMDPSHLLLGGWLTLTLVLGAVVLISSLRLARARAGWPEAEVEGVSVLVSREIGPAALGVVRGAIVLPAWVLGLEGWARRLILRHEAEHLRAGDPRLLLAGLVLVVLMPWNPVVWWQFGRLRQALELDCDSRVLRGEPDVRRYGLLLLEVGRRRGSGVLAMAGMAGMAEPRSFLERRIRMLGRVEFRASDPRLWGGAVVAIMLALLACDAREPASLSTEVELEASQSITTGSYQIIRSPRNEAAMVPANDVCVASYIVDDQPLGAVGDEGWSPGVLEGLDIESIEVFKGAAAGSLAEKYPGLHTDCGVVLVTTKSGSQVTGEALPEIVIPDLPSRVGSGHVEDESNRAPRS